MKRYLRAIFKPNKNMRKLSIIGRIKLVYVYGKLLKLKQDFDKTTGVSN
jgi:hypothetical protein